MRPELHPHERSTVTNIDLRPMHVCAYVETTFDEALTSLEQAKGSSTLASLLHDLLEPDAGVVTVQLRGPETTADGSACLYLTWTTTDAAGRERQRDATLSVLVVRSGREPITELLVSTVAPPDAAGAVAADVNRFLDALSAKVMELRSARV
jgi:hypothetical protein